MFLESVKQSTNSIEFEMNSLICLAEQESQNMVDFDDELVQIKKSLFPVKKGSPKKKIEVTQQMILEEVQKIQKYNETNYEMYIRERDPVLIGLSKDVSKFLEFYSKYSTFLNKSNESSSFM